MFVTATFVAIPEKTQTATAMKRVLDYVMQDKKTMFYDRENDRSYKLVSGQNCIPKAAFNEFWRQSIVLIKQRECSSNSMCNPSSRIAEQLLSRYIR